MDLSKYSEKETAEGVKHGLINALPNSVTKAKFKTKEQEEASAKERKKDAEVIRARYINHEHDEGRLERPYMRHAGDPITQWVFLNGEIYDVPRGLVKDVNDASHRRKERSGLLDAEGNALEKDKPGKKVHEFVGVI